MQLETADFAPCAATWQTARNIHVVFDVILAHSITRYRRDVIYKTESTLRIALISAEN